MYVGRNAPSASQIICWQCHRLTVYVANPEVQNKKGTEGGLVSWDGRRDSLRAAAEMHGLQKASSM